MAEDGSWLIWLSYTMILNEKSHLFNVWDGILHTHKYNFCTSLDFLGIKDLEKIKQTFKGQTEDTTPIHIIDFLRPFGLKIETNHCI